ncbi:hypothetical protein H632_c4843p0, partial [Helicosporidium sp. ATCC 50920]
RAVPGVSLAAADRAAARGHPASRRAVRAHPARRGGAGRAARARGALPRAARPRKRLGTSVGALLRLCRRELHQGAARLLRRRHLGQPASGDGAPFRRRGHGLAPAPPAGRRYAAGRDEPSRAQAERGGRVLDGPLPSVSGRRGAAHRCQDLQPRSGTLCRQLLCQLGGVLPRPARPRAPGCRARQGAGPPS